ncbi:MAG: hypothetical protein L0K86_21630, partial [Actinomycetia bacterium]|nr:hypothetical protein [Actinomycetes bacterium]
MSTTRPDCPTIGSHAVSAALAGTCSPGAPGQVTAPRTPAVRPGDAEAVLFDEPTRGLWGCGHLSGDAVVLVPNRGVDVLYADVVHGGDPFAGFACSDELGDRL